MPRDLHKYASSTTTRLVIGGMVILFVVGLGLIAWLYGTPAALLGFICILGGLVVVGLITVLVFGLDFILKRTDKN